MSGNKLHGVLSTITVELPPVSEEQRHRFEETNRELEGTGMRAFRAGTDWGYCPCNSPDFPVRFESGDLVKIFKTVSDGDIFWQGAIDFDRSDYQHGWQKNMEQRDWSQMFGRGLPARMERDGQVFFGALEPFCETGTEGVIWALKEYGSPDYYAGLKLLENGDSLTVYSTVRDGEVEWEGRLDFEREHPRKLGFMEVMRLVNHMDTQDWLRLSWEHRPVAVEPR